MSSDWRKKREGLLRDLGRILVKTGALEFGTFTLTSGKASSYYIDLRMIPSFPDVMKRAVEAYVEVLKRQVGLGKVDALAGIPTSGLTYASVVAYQLLKPLVYVRKEEKSYGKSRRIEGTLSPGWNVVVLDDLATTGISVTNAVDTIRAEGGEVSHAVVLIDRKEGADKALKEVGVKLNAFTTITELTDLLYDMELMNHDQIEAIRKQLGQ